MRQEISAFRQSNACSLAGQMADLQLPDDLVAFLLAGKQAEYNPSQCEAGKIDFLPLDRLKLEYFPTASESPEDPHKGELGCYLVRGVSLIASCENYDPIGLLLWLPFDKRYGLWDGEHGTLFIFGSEVTWSEIAGDLPRHINAEWGLDGSATVTNLAPWFCHTYNAEQHFHPLPDVQEWYEASWVRRGLFRDGVQVRFPEEIRIRVESDRGRCEVTSQTKKAEEGAEWSPPVTVPLRTNELRQVGPQLEHGFWNQPSMSPGGIGGEPATWWSVSGFRAGAYHSLSRSYEENRSKGNPVHELGKELLQLAGLNQLELDY